MPTNLEIIRGLYDAFGKGDVPRVLAMLAPDIHWTETEGFPYGGVYTGTEAVLNNVFMKLGTEWEGWSAVPSEFVADGDTVVSIGTYGGRFKKTGKSISVPFVHIWTLENGKAVRFRQVTDTAIVNKALE